MGSSTMQAVSKPGAGASLVDILNYQDNLKRAGQFEFLGRMKILVVEASAGASVPGVAETSRVGVRFDWRNEPGPDGTGYVDNFIPIAQSLDRQMLLALAPVVRRDGTVGLPDIPDPAWAPGMPTAEQIAPEMVKDPKRGWIVKDTGQKFSPDSPPMIKQPLEQRGVCELTDAPAILCAQPVTQIMFQPEIGGGLAATYWSIVGAFDPATRTDLAFLVDRRTGEAHFFGGRFSIVKPRGEF
jgi:hypothetical protein